MSRSHTGRHAYCQGVQPEDMMDTDGTMEQECCEDDKSKGYGTSNQTASQEESEQRTGQMFHM